MEREGRHVPCVRRVARSDWRKQRKERERESEKERIICRIRRVLEQRSMYFFSLALCICHTTREARKECCAVCGVERVERFG